MTFQCSPKMAPLLHASSATGQYSPLIILSVLKAAFYVGGEKQRVVFECFCVATVKREKLSTDAVYICFCQSWQVPVASSAGTTVGLVRRRCDERHSGASIWHRLDSLWIAASWIHLVPLKTSVLRHECFWLFLYYILFLRDERSGLRPRNWHTITSYIFRSLYFPCFPPPATLWETFKTHFSHRSSSALFTPPPPLAFLTESPFVSSLVDLITLPFAILAAHFARFPTSLSIRCRCVPRPLQAQSKPDLPFWSAADISSFHPLWGWSDDTLFWSCSPDLEELAEGQSCSGFILELELVIFKDIWWGSAVETCRGMSDGSVWWALEPLK